MRQELRTSLRTSLLTWRSEARSRLWLSALIATMEDLSRPDLRPVDVATLEALRAQLRLPASRRLCQGPASRLRH